MTGVCTSSTCIGICNVDIENPSAAVLTCT